MASKSCFILNVDLKNNIDLEDEPCPPSVEEVENEIKEMTISKKMPIRWKEFKRVQKDPSQQFLSGLTNFNIKGELENEENIKFSDLKQQLIDAVESIFDVESCSISELTE